MPADLLIHNAKVATNGVPYFVEAIAIGQRTPKDTEPLWGSGCECYAF